MGFVAFHSGTTVHTTGAYLERVQRVPRIRGFSEIHKSYLVQHPELGNYNKFEPVTKTS